MIIARVGLINNYIYYCLLDDVIGITVVAELNYYNFLIKVKIILTMRTTIDTRVKSVYKLANYKVKETKSLYGKFSIVWTLLQALFFSDDPQDFGKIDNTLEPDPDKPQMGTSPSDHGKSLLNG